MEQALYTIFWDDGFLTNHGSGNDWSGLPLLELIAKGHAEFCGNLVAWAAELPKFYDHHGNAHDGKPWTALRAESIAAGRVIELVDGKYVPRGVPVEEKKEEPLTLGALLRQAMASNAPSPTPTLDKLENEAEPQRAPMPHFNQRTDFDPFDGFAVSSNVEVAESRIPVHPLAQLRSMSHMLGNGIRDEVR